MGIIKQLLICVNNIMGVFNFFRFLLQHHVLNAIQPKKESFIVAKAGLPGSVTIATNAAGRGTDVRLANEVLQSGGLHVVVGFYPANMDY